MIEEGLVDKDLLRIVLAVIGVFLLLGIYLWDRWRRRHRRLDDAHLRDDIEERELDPIMLNPAEERTAESDPGAAFSPFEEQAAEIPPEPAEQSDGVVEEGSGASIDHLDESTADAAASAKPLPELIQLCVVAPSGTVFTGRPLVQALTDLGLEYGDMEIFHFADRQSGATLFSVATLIEPGTFPVASDDLSAFECPGLLLFLQPRAVADPLAAFDAMVEISHALARRLGGEEWDAKRNRLTDASIIDLRQSLLPD